MIGATVVIVLAIIKVFWRSLLFSSINEEMAHVEGINIERMRLLLMLLIAVVISVGMKFVGALIMTSLLIIPAAAARRLARTPEQMAILASIIGVIAVMGGLSLSWFFDTPAGPSVVVCASTMFVLTQVSKIRS